MPFEGNYVFLSSSYSYVKCMKIIKNTSWCHLSLVTLVSVTAVSFLSWLIHEPYLHLLPSYSFGLPGSPPPLHKLWCQTFFFCAFNISHSACLRGYRTHLLCYWSLSLAFFFPIFTIVISEETRWTVEPSLALFFNLFIFFVRNSPAQNVPKLMFLYLEKWRCCRLWANR